MILVLIIVLILVLIYFALFLGEGPEANSSCTLLFRRAHTEPDASQAVDHPAKLPKASLERRMWYLFTNYNCSGFRVQGLGLGFRITVLINHL